MWIAAIVVVILLLAWRFHRKWGSGAGKQRAWQPANRLEQLLAAAAETEGEAELWKELAQAKVLTWITDHGKPMIFEVAVEKEVASALGQSDAPLNYGPWLICFSSQETLSSLDPAIRTLFDTGRFAEVTIPDLAAQALALKLDLAMNPLAGVSRLFGQQELEKLAKSQ